MQRPFALCNVRKATAGAVRTEIEARQEKLSVDKKKSPQTCAVTVWELVAYMGDGVTGR